MSNALTDKTMVLISKLGDFWVSERQADEIMQTKQHEPDATIKLGGNFIACHSIDGVLSAPDYDVLNARRRGAWQCKFKYWHERGQGCAHFKSVQ